MNQALVIMLFALCLRLQWEKSQSRELEHRRLLRELLRIGVIYLRKRPRVKGWL